MSYKLRYLKFQFMFVYVCVCERRKHNLLVPTLWLDGMSMVLVVELCFTARPRSAMTAVPFFFTRTFLDLRSL